MTRGACIPAHQDSRGGQRNRPVTGRIMLNPTSVLHVSKQNDTHELEASSLTYFRLFHLLLKWPAVKP